MIATLIPDEPPSAVSIEPGLRRSASQLAAEYDAALVRRFNAGDETAFVEIMNRFRERIFATAFALLRNAADADDITQDTFIRAHRGLANFRGEASLATWLHHIATNLSRNHYWFFVRRRRHVTSSLDCPLTIDGRATYADVIASEEPSPSHSAVSGEFSALIVACMGQLQASHQEILTLRNALDQSYEQIARALGVKVGTVKSRIGRARENLRKLMAGACPEFGPDASLSEWFEPARTGGRIT